MKFKIEKKFPYFHRHDLRWQDSFCASITDSTYRQECLARKLDGRLQLVVRESLKSFLREATIYLHGDSLVVWWAEDGEPYREVVAKAKIVELVRDEVSCGSVGSIAYRDESTTESMIQTRDALLQAAALIDRKLRPDCRKSQQNTAVTVTSSP